MRSTKSKLPGIAAFAFILGMSSLASAESAGQYIDDAAITTKVKAAMLGNSTVKASQVSVQTTQGTVELSGTVENKAQEAEAVRLANGVSGVKAVKDEIRIKGETSDTRED